jgi:PPOX class probable F420-dependent enzyme
MIFNVLTGVSMSVPSLTEFTRLARSEHDLSVLATLRPNGSIQASIVNAGVLRHPITGQEVVGLVALGGSQKLANLRANPTATAIVRAGWEWVAVEGEADLIGPQDPVPELGADQVRMLLRDVFTAAGGTHDDWATYDATMLRERRTALLLNPVRVYSNARS